MKFITVRRVVVCPTCNRRRTCYAGRFSCGPVDSPRRYRLWRCSQGHVWYVELGTLARITEVTMSHILPVIAADMFKSSPLLDYLRAR